MDFLIRLINLFSYLHNKQLIVYVYIYILHKVYIQGAHAISSQR